jgi:hypothetical protein
MKIFYSFFEYEFALKKKPYLREEYVIIWWQNIHILEVRKNKITILDLSDMRPNKEFVESLTEDKIKKLIMMQS